MLCKTTQSCTSAGADTHVYCSCTNRCHVSMTVSILYICNKFQLEITLTFLSLFSWRYGEAVKAQG